MKRHTTRSPLAQLPLLADAPDAVLARLETLMTPVRVRAGEVLVREGARNRQFVLLQEGTLRVTRDGRQVAELGAGDFVGEQRQRGEWGAGVALHGGSSDRDGVYVLINAPGVVRHAVPGR